MDFDLIRLYWDRCVHLSGEFNFGSNELNANPSLRKDKIELYNCS
jgi:hypothetical protein